ncbi:uncharacterized protein LOC117089571 [Trachypithecus francoisi]|uniref:uncharacterized protein LOC117089571 n=1 Tax=Trachypithecus francoisi TaxID=54180 RepID=UPI00141A7EAE|nr:uncharacterized protein LOC117089571 [Trachypithecus francoisi]
MAGPLRAPLLLLAILAVALAVNPAAGASPGKPPRLVGGPMDASVEEEGVRRALDFAVSEYNKASNDLYHSRALQVARARRQVRAAPRRVPSPGPAAPARPAPLPDPALLLLPGTWASHPDPVPGLRCHPGALGGRAQECPESGLAWNRKDTPGPHLAPEICFQAPARAAPQRGGRHRTSHPTLSRPPGTRGSGCAAKYAGEGKNRAPHLAASLFFRQIIFKHFSLTFYSHIISDLQSSCRNSTGHPCRSVTQIPQMLARMLTLCRLFPPAHFPNVNMGVCICPVYAFFCLNLLRVNTSVCFSLKQGQYLT